MRLSQMNGFDAVELPRPNLLSRLLGRKPKAHALLEIQNLLAGRSLDTITSADVEHILSE